jgi:hypothetical protein
MMEGSKGKSNAKSLFGVHEIPSDNHIRDLLDPVEPKQIFPVFEEILQVLEQQGQLQSFRSLAGNLLMAMDGTEYFSSGQIHCPHCSTRQLKSGEMRYFHSVVTPVLVCPGQSQVIPLVPEFVVPQDGHDKQDCENAAAKRWLGQHGERYSALKVTVLGDDLYCHQPLCQQLLAQGFNLSLVCRPESHATLYEKYTLLRSHLPTRQTFFDDLRALTRYLYFENWDHLLTFMLEGLELQIPPNTS